MRVTIKDVSREAGVSIKTVSRVLNNEKYVGAETRARVSAVVERLNFRPSSAARALAGKRSFQVALICDNPSPYYVYEMQSGIRDRCEEAGVRLIAQPYDRQSSRLLDEIEALIESIRIDGLILTPPATDNPAVLALLRARGVPFVRVSPGSDVGVSPSVFIDNRRAAADMTRHLIDLGHSRIGFITGDPDFATSAQRSAGYRDALGDGGIAVDPALIRPGTYGFASGESEAEALLALAQPPTAIFAANDDMAAGVLAVAHRLGVRVPDQLSIAGFDDTPIAGFVWPPLSTVRQPTRQMAYQAADLLLSPGEDASERRELDYAIIARGSTAPVVG